MALLSIFFASVFPSILAASSSPTPFVYHSYSEIVDRLQAIQRDYPHLVTLTSANTRFNLPTVGTCDGKPCHIYIVELASNVTTSATTATSSKPEVIISGELHGDERVGPHAVLALLHTLTSRYNTSTYIRNLVDRRRVLLLPTTNAVGFAHNRRGELYSDATELDPNRDFAFHQSPTACMRTVAARVINELFLTHLFRIMLTFHGGTNVLGYEWGDFGHCEENGKCEVAPDHAAMDALARRMQEYAGPAGAWEPVYRVGDMGSTVYPVNGGMEDWAYGASWAQPRGTDEVVCVVTNSSSGGGGEVGAYPEGSTNYSAATHRCVTYLVETGTQKKPDESTLGADSEEILDRDGEGNGHVPRNVRLAVAAIDGVEPYVMVLQVEHSGHPRGHRQEAMYIDWAVGGGFRVDETWVQWSTAPGENVRAGATEHMFDDIPFPSDSEFKWAAFRQTVYLSSFTSSKSSQLYFRAVAKVDSALVRTSADVAPQSHFVNARLNPDWGPYVNGDSKVSGRALFTSDTFRVYAWQPEFKVGVDNSLPWGGTDDGPGGLTITATGEGDAYERPYLPRTGIVIFLGMVAIAVVSMVVVKVRQRRQGNALFADEESGEVERDGDGEEEERSVEERRRNGLEKEGEDEPLVDAPMTPP